MWLTASASAQIVEVRAVMNAAQEAPATSSPATGTGLMLYSVATNTFDLVVTLDRYANPMTHTALVTRANNSSGNALIEVTDIRSFTAAKIN